VLPARRTKIDIYIILIDCSDAGPGKASMLGGLWTVQVNAACSMRSSVPASLQRGQEQATERASGLPAFCRWTICRHRKSVERPAGAYGHRARRGRQPATSTTATKSGQLLSIDGAEAAAPESGRRRRRRPQRRAPVRTAWVSANSGWTSA